MKKRIAMVLCLALAACCVACTSANKNVEDESSTPSTIVTEATQCQHTYIEEVYKEANYGVDGIRIKYCPLCGDIEYIPIPALTAVFEVEVKNKTTYTDGTLNGIFFDIEIKNTSDKEIQFISGNLSVLASGSILELICEFEDLSLKPGETILKEMYGVFFDNTMFGEEAYQKVYDAEFSSIRFIFSTTDVVVAE